MYLHEIFVECPVTARLIKQVFEYVESDVKMTSYPMTDDTEMYIIKLTRRYGEDAMRNNLAGYDIGELITTKLEV